MTNEPNKRLKLSTRPYRPYGRHQNKKPPKCFDCKRSIFGPHAGRQWQLKEEFRLCQKCRPDKVTETLVDFHLRQTAPPPGPKEYARKLEKKVDLGVCFTCGVKLHAAEKERCANLGMDIAFCLKHAGLY